MSTPTLLVTGAGGKLGRQVVKFLLDAKAGHIIAASRDTTKLSDLATLGVEIRRADFDDAASLSTAFDSVDRVLIISTDALGSGQRLAQHLAAIKAAKDAGVTDIVYTSMPNPDGSAVTFAGDHLGTEQAVIASGVNYTILRNAWYQENLFMNLPSAFASGTLYSSADGGRISYIAHVDCARGAAAALSRPSTNEIMTLTGPALYTITEVAAMASKVTGKPLAVVNISDEQLAGGLKTAGLPEAIIPMLVSFDTNSRQGGFDILTSDFEQLTGHAPLPLDDFLTANKAALAG